MIIGLFILTVALGLVLQIAWKQNRALRQLQEAAQRNQPYLREENPTNFLPQWRPLVDAINQLIRSNSTLQHKHTDQLSQLEATLGNLREAVLIVDESNYIHLANRALRVIFPAARDIVNLRLELIVRSGPFIEYVRATRTGPALPRQEFEIIDGPSTIWI